MNNTETLHFKTHTLLKNLVGKDLINDDNIAIVELIKNSYDAESEKVDLIFSGFDEDGGVTNDSTILIADWGCGMDARDIREKWLNIAYSEKKNVGQQRGAYLAGNKGIGRFSCDRLGETLSMFTRKLDGEILHLDINWLDFEKEDDQDLTIQQIPVKLTGSSVEEIEKLTSRRMPRSGTILLIRNPRSSWSRKALLDLKSHLEKFINPNQLFQKKGFEINLIAEHLADADEGKDYHHRVNGLVKNLIFENLDFNSTYIQAEIGKDGETVKTELYHDGQPVYRLIERNSDYPLLSDVRIVIYYLNPYKKAYFKRQTGIRSVDFGSIFLFLNGFRVEPYGERGDDWLGLDVRKTQGTTRYLGSRDLVGRIEVVGHEQAYKPISSREGLKNTRQFNSLRREFFLDVIRRLERFVVDGLDWDSIPLSLRNAMRDDEGRDWKNTQETYIESWDKKRERISLSIMSISSSSKSKMIRFWFNTELLEGLYEEKSEHVQQLVSSIEEYGEGKLDSDLVANLKEIKNILAEKEHRLIEKQEEIVGLKERAQAQEKRLLKLEKQRDTYQAATHFLQSSSTLDEKRLLSFHHQISNDAITVNNWIGKAIRLIQQGAAKDNILTALEKAVARNRQIMTTAQIATKANFRLSIKHELFDIPSFVEQYIREVSTEFTANGMRLAVKNTVNEAFELKVKRLDLSMLIDNIISNSYKAGAKSVLVNLELSGKNELMISFRDDGEGLSDAIANIQDCFNIGVTTTVGSGVGLYHVKEIVEGLRGSVEIFDLKTLNERRKGFLVGVVLSR